MEKLKLQFEHEKQLEREKFEHEKEMKRLELESRRGESQHSVASHTQSGFDLTKSIRLVPKFNEHDVESYFVSFEKIAMRLEWPTEFWTLL